MRIARGMPPRRKRVAFVSTASASDVNRAGVWGGATEGAGVGDNVSGPTGASSPCAKAQEARSSSGAAIIERRCIRGKIGRMHGSGGHDGGGEFHYVIDEIRLDVNFHEYSQTDSGLSLMSITPPKPQLTDNEKKLILLLSKLLSENNNCRIGSNQAEGYVTLSDGEVLDLVEMVDKFISSRNFIESSFFVEELSLGDPEDRCRKIFLDRRRRARIMSSAQWLDFQARLGVIPSAKPYRNTDKMSEEYFRKLESKLLLYCGVNPKLVENIDNLIASHQEAIESLREAKTHIRRGYIKEIIFRPIQSMKIKIEESARRVADRTIPASKLIGAITVVSDMSVIFTTRDWGVAGTISTLAGATVATVAD